MKQNHIITSLVAVLITLSFQACRDEFDMSQIDKSRKLSVSCYPSTADTTWIWVSRTIPVDKQSTVHQDFSIGNASIIYQVNGQPREVCEKEPGLYYTCSPQKVGDKVTIEVSANGFERVTSEATVPNAIPIRLEGLKKITTYNHDIDRFATYDQLTATFSDPEATTDFYAVRVSTKAWYMGWPIPFMMRTAISTTTKHNGHWGIQEVPMPTICATRRCILMPNGMWSCRILSIATPPSA